MPSFTRLLIAGLVAASSLGGQQPPDPAHCRAILTGAALDSQTFEVRIAITAFDTTRQISDQYKSMIGVGARQFFAIPRPLELNTYDYRSSLDDSIVSQRFAALAVYGVYRTILHDDGTFTDARAVGGARDEALDSSFVLALQQLSASKMLPPPGRDVQLSHGALDIRIVLISVVGTSDTTFAHADADQTPLFRVRVPVRHVTQIANAKPDNPEPHYPPHANWAQKEGDALLDFVINADGTPDLSSIQVVRATYTDFASAVLENLPSMRFVPLTVEGCPVRVRVGMPFEFKLRRP